MAHNVAVGLYGMTHWLFIWHGEGGGVVAHYVAEGSNGARQWLTLWQGDSSVTLSQPPPAGWGNGSLLGKGGAQCGQGVPAGQGLELTIWQGGVEGGGGWGGSGSLFGRTGRSAMAQGRRAEPSGHVTALY